MFDFLKRTKKPNPDASRLLASILVVFPAVQSVTYESKGETLELSFALNGKFSQEELENFLSYVAESLETFHHLEGLGCTTMELNVEGVYGTCFLNVRRDVATLTCRELSLLTELAASYFGDQLIEEYDENYFPDEEYLIAQENYLEQCLNNMRQMRVEGRLVGVREHERVVVYAR
ncbi:MAG: hypothetical protein IJT47_04600 [Selenomonadaceae bacterium]|nr:hypothetical protein [Selenomonadaceae bacterium]MBQ7493686.1 hypothetical protein [Selenomonadaceae bacterium]